MTDGRSILIPLIAQMRDFNVAKNLKIALRISMIDFERAPKYARSNESKNSICDELLLSEFCHGERNVREQRSSDVSTDPHGSHSRIMTSRPLHRTCLLSPSCESHLDWSYSRFRTAQTVRFQSSSTPASDFVLHARGPSL